MSGIVKFSFLSVSSINPRYFSVDIYYFEILIVIISHFPIQTQIISDDTWKLIDGVWDKRVQEIRDEASIEIEEEKEKPELLMASHFL